MNQATHIPFVLSAIFLSLCSAAIEFAVPQNVPPLFEPGVTPRSEAGWRNVRRPELKKIEVWTYSPQHDEVCLDVGFRKGRHWHEFTLELD